MEPLAHAPIVAGGRRICSGPTWRSRATPLGGDADTTGAIVGALAGGTVGASSIPADWLAISDWPRSLAWIRTLGERVTQRGAPLRLGWPFIPLRNAVFTAIVLATGLRRLLPPY